MVKDPSTSGDTLCQRTIKLRREFPECSLTQKVVWIAQQRVAVTCKRASVL